MMDTAAVTTVVDDLASARLFRALADSTRLRALVLMGIEGELCVCELTHALGVSQPKMSRHLAVLKHAGLVADRRERYWIHYRLAEDVADWTREALDAVIRGNADVLPFCADRERLSRMVDKANKCREDAR